LIFFAAKHSRLRKYFQMLAGRMVFAGFLWLESFCLVNSGSAFTEQPLVANGASELFQDVFGKERIHAHSATGVAQLPMGACVEIELIAEIR
jgi:enamine deaminase RidA (YjgF/YER057c/UK114 family)